MRRTLAVFLLATFAAAAPSDLRPRYGNGWTGLKEGSAIRMKVTREAPQRVPFVTVQTTVLVKATKTQLKLEQVSENQLTKDRKTSWWVPSAGEAQVGEKETRRRLDNEKVQAAGRTWDCSCQEITVTGKNGRRVITEWTARKPLIRVKRLEKWYGPDGKPTETRSIVISKAPQERVVAERKVLCIGYRAIAKSGDTEQRAETWHSRQVPGDLAGGKIEFLQKGKKISTLHFKVLRFEVK